MKLKYTKRISGYIASLLGLFTVRVFLEALIHGYGPIPGLSFLFYTMLFYVHYNEENITKYSMILFDATIDQAKTFTQLYSQISFKDIKDLMINKINKINIDSLEEKVDIQLRQTGSSLKILDNKITSLYTQKKYKKYLNEKWGKIESIIMPKYKDFIKSSEVFYNPILQKIKRKTVLMKSKSIRYYEHLVKRGVYLIELFWSN